MTRTPHADPTSATWAPTLPGLPVLGSGPDLRHRLLETQLRALHELGDVVRFSAGPPGARLVLHSVFAPEGVQHVLARESARYRKDGRLYTALRDDIGDGLLTSQDETWLRQKRFVQPLFTHARVHEYLPAMAAEAEALVRRWEGPARTGEPLELHSEASRLTLRVVGRVLLGADLDEAVPLFGSVLPVLGAHVRRRGFSPVAAPAGWPTPSNLRATRARRRVHRLVDDLVAQRRSTGQLDGDLLGRLVAARDGDSRLSDAELRDQLLVFLFAGTDTTATTLTFALHLLGSHPEVQQQVHEEVSLLPAGSSPSPSDLAGLALLTRVVKEALRLYPPAYATSRRLTGGDDVVSGVRIPDGSDVAVYPWVTHRHPRHWDDPDRFDPGRFTPEREAARHRYAWFPFGGGPRTCIGGHFALVEALVALAAVLRAYRVEAPDHAVPVIPRVTLHPAGPVWCRLAPR